VKVRCRRAAAYRPGVCSRGLSARSCPQERAQPRCGRPEASSDASPHVPGGRIVHCATRGPLLPVGAGTCEFRLYTFVRFPAAQGPRNTVPETVSHIAWPLGRTTPDEHTAPGYSVRFMPRYDALLPARSWPVERCPLAATVGRLPQFLRQVRREPLITSLPEASS
jgi:hypothetical protein